MSSNVVSNKTFFEPARKIKVCREADVVVVGGGPGGVGQQAGHVGFDQHPPSGNRAGIDPAVASSVFVTALTDLLGFLFLLGLATALLL